MESMQELIPFAKEVLSQRPTRGLLKVYLVGSIFAVLGTLMGLVEIMCHPFSSGEAMDEEMVFMLAREQRTVEAQTLCSVECYEEEEEEELVHKNGAMTQSMTLSKTDKLSQRSSANRLHAS